MAIFVGKGGEKLKQDRNGVRTAQDLERKYNLGEIVGIKKAVEMQEEGINKTKIGRAHV